MHLLRPAYVQIVVKGRVTLSIILLSYPVVLEYNRFSFDSNFDGLRSGNLKKYWFWDCNCRFLGNAWGKNLWLFLSIEFLFLLIPLLMNTLSRQLFQIRWTFSSLVINFHRICILVTIWVKMLLVSCPQEEDREKLFEAKLQQIEVCVNIHLRVCFISMVHHVVVLNFIFLFLLSLSLLWIFSIIIYLLYLRIMGYFRKLSSIL